MDALVLKHANAMPAKTWHRLHMNDTCVEIPAGLSRARAVTAEVTGESIFGCPGAFEKAVARAQAALDAKLAGKPEDTRAVLIAANGSAAADDLDVPALSAYEKRAVEEEVAQDILAAFETGMGTEAAEYLTSMAGEAGSFVFATQPGRAAAATVRVNGIDGAANVAAVDVVAAPASQFTLNVAFDSPASGTGVVGLHLRVFAGTGARVNVATIHTLSDSWTALDDEGYVLDENALVSVEHRVLGAGRAYTGCACDLRGDGANAGISTRYLGHGTQTRDFNYVVRHRGRKTTCNIDANGVLADASKKVLRGTIDLVHGCKGSQGTERETVLLADEQVENKTIPVILCDEDDVAGNHGATIGHVRPEQLNYLMARGISQEAAERLFANATLEEAAITAPDAQVRAAVTRLARELGVPFELVEDASSADDATGTAATTAPDCATCSKADAQAAPDRTACAIADAAVAAAASAAAPDIVCAANIAENPYKRDFPLLANHPGLAFLDSAATAQRPKTVLDAQRRFYEEMNANALRGLYRLSVEATEAIDVARHRVARFIGAPNPRDIVLTRNASESLNLVAKAFAPTVLSEGDEVCITIMEHHSNLIPWQQACRAAKATLVYLYPDENGIIQPAEMDAKIGPRTKIVAAAHVSNVLGVENPVEELGRRVHAQGGYLVVDGAQSVPHIPVDIQKLGCDFFAFSAHKLFGPFGMGVLWGKDELLDAMPPFLTGGEMIENVTEQSATWAPVPEKFEAGTQDAAGIYATAAAIAYVESVGLSVIGAREQALVRYCMDEMGKLPFVQIIGSPNACDHHGVISFNVNGIHPHDVASILDMDQVAIRAGHHCAQPLLTWLGVENLACCRASLAFYNDKSDVDALIAGLKNVWRTFNGS